MSLMENRIMFDYDVDRLLVDKPERYKQIIRAKIKRAMEYQEKISDKYISTDLVIGFMIKLDEDYVSVREDNE